MTSCMLRRVNGALACTALVRFSQLSAAVVRHKASDGVV